MNRIEFDSIWWKHILYLYEFASYRETTYYVLIERLPFGR